MENHGISPNIIELIHGVVLSAGVREQMGEDGFRSDVPDCVKPRLLKGDTR